MRGLHAHARWILPVIAAFFVTLAVLAKVNALPWDRPITEWIADHRTTGLNHFWKNITELGGDRVVFIVAAACAALAWPRCRPLAVAIVALALARPVIVIALKEIVARNRPPTSLAITHPGGYSFPSGHPFSVAASWGFIPLVVALYTQRHWIWWATVIVVWSMVVVVAASRVYLGAHWTTDVIGTLSLAVVFVAGSEVFISWLHRHIARPALQCAVQNEARDQATGTVTQSRPRLGGGNEGSGVCLGDAVDDCEAEADTCVLRAYAFGDALERFR
jgi:membrane-associated phospholipid phosphatase